MAAQMESEGNCMDRGFESLGRSVGRHPWKFTLGAVFISAGLSSGFGSLPSENRPEKQWVPEGAIALGHNEYVTENWPSNTRYDMWIAECATPGCNMLDATHIKRMAEIHEEMLAVVIDGDAIVETFDGIHGKDKGQASFAGNWSFGAISPYPGGDTQAICFKTGASCMEGSIMQAFDLDAVASLTDDAALVAVNAWVGASPANTARIPGLLGDAVQDNSGAFVSASAIIGAYTLSMNEVFFESSGNNEDPIADEWEAAVLCVLGIDADEEDKYTDCVADDLISFKANFRRSFGDEFGKAISGDIKNLAIGYMLILVYLLIMLSGFDVVNSMIGMSFVALLIVGLSYGSCMGIGSFIGLFNNNLNNNIPFLLLGLGVDDSFVLSSEFKRATRLMPGASIEERIGVTMRTGGVSILITSATDALAFLVGSITVLPALSWFCTFAGIGVVMCFLLQVFIFVPCLAINAQRSEANRLDVICCAKSKTEDHDLDTPQGCCGVCRCGCCLKTQKQATWFENTFGEFVTSKVGIGITIAVFVALAVVGLIGCTKIYKDFKLEWFIPDDSYVTEYFTANAQYSEAGTRFFIYTPSEIDYFTEQSTMVALSTYVKDTPYIDKAQPLADWHSSFLAFAVAMAAPSMTNGLYMDASAYYTDLRTYLNSAGTQYRSNVQWVSDACNDDDLAVRMGTDCDVTKGIDLSRFGATISMDYTERGTDRYDCMIAMRSEISAIMEGAFPFTFSFMYWEEVGVIGGELRRNLLISGGVIIVIVFMLVQKIQISLIVVGAILFSIADVVGLLYYWDVTISGVSTIYVLICVGLAVDYSAHIAHMFKESTGTSQERIKKALGRIGPSVFNAVISTLLAVIVIGFSKSYVFRIFFKAFFLVTVIAGAHGLWLLPVLLGQFGGSNLKVDPPYDGEKGIKMQVIGV